MQGVETITTFNEVTLLGYFETIRSVFLTKFLFLASHVRQATIGATSTQAPCQTT